MNIIFLPVVILIFHLLGCAVIQASIAAETDKTVSHFKKITINGDKTLNGIFDLSVEYGDDGIGWMVYSRVSFPKYVSTHLAKSTDQGKTWNFVVTINKSLDETRTAKGKTFEGVWRNETPSLLFDPEDAPERRWKLFSQRYYAIPPFKKGDSLFDKGWIEMKTAKSPAGPWSPAQCLFGKIQKHCLLDPNSLSDSLKDNLFYNEIGSLVHHGVIYLSVDASTTADGLGDWKKRKVVLFSSKDHGKQWQFTGTLTDYNDADAFGYLVFTGSSLVKEKGKLYLLATPSGAKKLFVKNRAHDGTYVIEFEDITRAELKRDNEGKLQVTKKFTPEFHSGGLSDYDEKNTQGGILFSQIKLEDKPEFFQIYNTGDSIQ